MDSASPRRRDDRDEGGQSLQVRKEQQDIVQGGQGMGLGHAIEFLTSPEKIVQLHSALAALSPDRKTLPPYFEVLLTTTVENAVPGDASIVAVRAVQP
jgi:hypothetical protein